MPHFSLIVPLENPLKRALHEERRQARRVALLLLLEIAPRHDEEVVGDIGQRNPHLLAGQHVAVALLHGHRLDAADVAARRRLREAEGGDLLALRLRHEVLALLRLGAPREQAQAVEPRVHGHDHAQRGVDVLQFLAGEAEADVVHARAAVLRRHRNAEQAELRHLRQDVGIEPVLPVEILDARRDLAGAPLAHRLLEQTMFVGEGKVHDDSA